MCGRAPTTSAWRLERADGQRARRRRCGRSSGRTTWTRRARPPPSCSRRCATTNGRLLRTYNRGQAKLPAYLEDHAYLLEALLTLYEATFEGRWFDAARDTADTILARFADPESGGFFSTADDATQLVARRKELEDAPIPSGGASAAFGLLRLALLTGEAAYEEAALGHLRLVHPLTAGHPTTFGHALHAIDLHVGPSREIALVGEGLEPLERVVRERLRPRTVLAGDRHDAEAGHPGHVALLAGRTPIDGVAAAYVCERFACRTPVTEPGALAALLDGQST